MVYIDLLVFENIVLNYLVLLATSYILNRLVKLPKILLSSFFGCIPLIFLFTSLKTSIVFFITLCFSIIMAIIAFQYKDIKYTISNVIYMYLISIFLGGSIYLLNTSFFPEINNFTLNFVILILLSTIITFLYIKSINKIKTNYSNYYIIDIYLKGHDKITINSYLDTGNTLKDPYRKWPIILVDENKINYQQEKLLLVPYNTIDSHGLLKCFRPEKIYIDKVGYRKKLLIGLIDSVGFSGADCILNKDLLERI